MQEKCVLRVFVRACFLLVKHNTASSCIYLLIEVWNLILGSLLNLPVIKGVVGPLVC